MVQQKTRICIRCFQTDMHCTMHLSIFRNEFFEGSSTPIDNKLPDDLSNSFCGSMKRFDPTNKRRLPARIVLRPLASYKVLFYIFIAYAILSLWQRSFISSTV